MSKAQMAELSLALHALKEEVAWAHKQAIGGTVPDLHKVGTAYKHLEQLIIRMDNE